MTVGQPVFGIPDKKICIITREVSRTIGSDLNFVLLGLHIPSLALSSSRESLWNPQSMTYALKYDATLK
jgi:hypothetical protein